MCAHPYRNVVKADRHPLRILHRQTCACCCQCDRCNPSFPQSFHAVFLRRRLPASKPPSVNPVVTDFRRVLTFGVHYLRRPRLTHIISMLCRRHYVVSRCVYELRFLFLKNMSFNGLPLEMVAAVCDRCNSEDLASLCRVSFTTTTSVNYVINVLFSYGVST